MKDTYAPHAAGTPEWSGTIAVVLDPAETLGQLAPFFGIEALTMVLVSKLL